MKLIALAMAILCGGVLISATVDFPVWGDPNSPASTYLSPYFLQHSMEDAGVPNVVTTVLADYRGFDTMFETVVVFAAGVACFLLLRIVQEDTPQEHFFRHLPTGMVVHVKKPLSKPPNPALFQEIDRLWTPRDLVVEFISRQIIPFIQLFGLYVIAHGHHSPGGGFQGGVILAASIILLAISTDLRTASLRVREQFNALLSATGVCIYAGVGAFCLALGSNFLDYSALSPILRVDPAGARSLGIFFVEIGVGLAVMATMILIYKNLASAGQYRQGL